MMNIVVQLRRRLREAQSACNTLGHPFEAADAFEAVLPILFKKSTAIEDLTAERDELRVTLLACQKELSKYKEAYERMFETAKQASELCAKALDTRK